MTYDINKAFLAANAGAFTKDTQGQNFYGPNGSRWQVVNTTHNNSPSGYQGALIYEQQIKRTALAVNDESYRSAA